MVEQLVLEWERADKVVELFNNNVRASTIEILTVVNGAPCLDNVRALLEQECSICGDVCPPSEVSPAVKQLQV